MKKKRILGSARSAGAKWNGRKWTSRGIVTGSRFGFFALSVTKKLCQKGMTGNITTKWTNRSTTTIKGAGDICEYCKTPGKTLAVIEEADPRIFISIQGAYLQIFNEDYPGFVENIKIKCCPMRGRNLEENK